jgi:hypothetical protein
VLTENLMHQPHHQLMIDSSHTDFLMTHPLLFTKASDSLEVDNWLRITESRFGLLHCTESQNTLYAP